MSEPSNQPPVLHVHGQRFPQDPVEIFGTSVALESLINALIEGVTTGRGGCTFMVSDGNESEVRVACLNGHRRGEEWRRSGSPYLDVEDPLVARIIELTDEVSRLRQIVQMLRTPRTAGASGAGSGATG